MNLPIYLAFRYFKAKKGIHAVNIIVIFSVLAISISTAAMLIFLSVFSGLQNLNIQFISNINPEIKILPIEGKTLKGVEKLEKLLYNNKQIQSFAKEIEEKVYITYRDRNQVANLKAVDKNFTKVYPLDTTVIAGNYPSFTYSNEMIISSALAFKMEIPISNSEYAKLYMPTAGTGKITNLEEDFIIKPVYLTGVFYINDQYDNTIFAPLELAESLLSLPKNSATSIHIKLKNAELRNDIKLELENTLAKDYRIVTREDQDAQFLKMMNVEKLIIYLILTLIIIITTFNLAGAIVVVILDKKIQTKTLLSLGLDLGNIRKTFFYTGLIIVLTGLMIGIVTGSIILILQQNYQWVRPQNFAFPVYFSIYNYLVVILTVSIFGGLVAFLSSRKVNF